MAVKALMKRSKPGPPFGSGSHVSAPSRRSRCDSSNARAMMVPSGIIQACSPSNIPSASACVKMAGRLSSKASATMTESLESYSCSIA
eukprot:4603250-Prymnesium_polylepis.2